MANIKKIYEGIPNQEKISKTDKLNGAIAIYLNVPNESDHFEIDFYLQIDVNLIKNKLIQLNENFILDTVLIIPIPIEYQLIEFDLIGAFWTEFNVNLEIFAYFPDTSFIDIDKNLKEIKENQQQITENQDELKLLNELNLTLNTAQSLSLTAQNLSLIALATGLAPITVGATLPATAPLLALPGI